MNRDEIARAREKAMTLSCLLTCLARVAEQTGGPNCQELAYMLEHGAEMALDTHSTLVNVDKFYSGERNLKAERRNERAAEHVRQVYRDSPPPPLPDNVVDVFAWLQARVGALAPHRDDRAADAMAPEAE